MFEETAVLICGLRLDRPNERGCSMISDQLLQTLVRGAATLLLLIVWVILCRKPQRYIPIRQDIPKAAVNLLTSRLTSTRG